MRQVREVLAQIVATGVQHGSTAAIAIWTTLPTCKMRTITSAAQEIRKYIQVNHSMRHTYFTA